MAKTIRFTLNGEPASVTTDADRMLLWVLRTELGLTGTKFGCGEGFCGSCSVVVDGRVERSCQLPMEKVAGAEVLTIEGLADGDDLHPLQQAFVDHDALQCGFCTPGMIMNAYGLLEDRKVAVAVADHRRHGGQPLPLRRPQAHRRRHRERGGEDGEGGEVMSPTAREILDYLGIDPPSEVSRRRFLELFGGGIFIAVAGCDLAAQETAAPRRFGRQLPDDFNAFLRIGEDGRVTCFTGKIEMGQGVHTSLAQMLADELEVPLDVVDMVMGDTDLCPWDMGTFGSMTTRFFGPPLRAAAAEAREVLLELAAEKLEVPRDQLAVADGVVSVTGQPQRSVDLRRACQGAAHRAPARPRGGARGGQGLHHRRPFRDPPRRRRQGHRPRAVSPATFAAKGMVCARLLRPPAHGAKLLEVDASGLEAVPGATVVRDGDLIAVVHATPDGAERGRQQLQATLGHARSPTSTRTRSSTTC